jgi:acyl carrier protein
MRLYQIVANVLKVDPKTLSCDSNAQNTKNWDSLRHIEVIFAVENAYHVRFTLPEITSLRKLGDIRRLLVAKGAACSSEEPSVGDLSPAA